MNLSPQNTQSSSKRRTLVETTSIVKPSSGPNIAKDFNDMLKSNGIINLESENQQAVPERPGVFARKIQSVGPEGGERINAAGQEKRGPVLRPGIWKCLPDLSLDEDGFVTIPVIDQAHSILESPLQKWADLAIDDDPALPMPYGRHDRRGQEGIRFGGQALGKLLRCLKVDFLLRPVGVLPDHLRHQAGTAVLFLKSDVINFHMLFYPVMTGTLHALAMNYSHPRS